MTETPVDDKLWRYNPRPIFSWQGDLEQLPKVLSFCSLSTRRGERVRVKGDGKTFGNTVKSISKPVIACQS
jgi:hypothetical protein